MLSPLLIPLPLPLLQQAGLHRFARVMVQVHGACAFQGSMALDRAWIGQRSGSRHLC